MAALAGIELGGTKTIVVRGDPRQIAERIEIPTTTPGETLSRATAILKQWHAGSPLQALGIGSFGPIRVDPAAADYGTMLATPKPGWGGAPLLATVRSQIDLPLLIDTDVNAAALAECEMGAAQGCSTIVYVTIGTGIGAGVIVEGMPLHGALHPETGHIRLRRAPGDSFAGTCPFHGDCLEGLVSGPALAARFGRHPGEAPADDPRWGFAASDLGELIAALLLSYAPQRIVIGGGVGLGQPQLLAGALRTVPGRIAGYLPDIDTARLSELVVAARLGNDAGPAGTLLLAQRALARG